MKKNNNTVEKAVNAALTNKNEDMTFTVRRLPVGTDTRRQVKISYYENYYGEKGVCVECDGAVNHIPTDESFKDSDEVKRIANQIRLDYFNELPEE